MELGTQGDVVVLHEMKNIIIRVRNKYWKLGKAIAQNSLPKEIKDTFFSLGNDIDKFLKLSNMLGEVKNETSSTTNTQ